MAPFDWEVGRREEAAMICKRCGVEAWGYRLLRAWRCMINRKRFQAPNGRWVRDREIYRLADEAERGYDVNEFRERKP